MSSYLRFLAAFVLPSLAFLLLPAPTEANCLRQEQAACSNAAKQAYTLCNEALKKGQGDCRVKRGEDQKKCKENPPPKCEREKPSEAALNQCKLASAQASSQCGSEETNQLACEKNFLGCQQACMKNCTVCTTEGIQPCVVACKKTKNSCLLKGRLNTYVCKYEAEKEGRLCENKLRYRIGSAHYRCLAKRQQASGMCYDEVFENERGCRVNLQKTHFECRENVRAQHEDCRDRARDTCRKK